MLDTYPIKPPFTLIFFFLLLLFFFLNHTFCFTLTLTHPFCFSLLLLSHLLKFSPTWNSWLNFIVFYFFFFSQLFFPNSVRLLLDFPSINPVHLPQKKFMFSHMFLWVFFFFGSTDVGCFLRIVILFYFFVICWLFPVRCLVLFSCVRCLSAWLRLSWWDCERREWRYFGFFIIFLFSNKAEPHPIKNT